MGETKKFPSISDEMWWQYGLESSELFAVDLAFGRLLNKAFRGYNANTGPDGWREFLKRDPRQKIVRSRHDDPRSFLLRFRRAGLAAQAGNGKPKADLPKLPCVAYFRSEGLDNDLNRGQTPWHNETVFRPDSKLPPLKLDFLPVMLSYTITFLAWDKLTLDKMKLAWYRFISYTKGGRNRFHVPYLISGEQIDMVPAEVMDARTLSMNDVSLPFEEGRLFAVQMDYTVDTVAVVGREISFEGKITHDKGEWEDGRCYGRYEVVTRNGRRWLSLVDNNCTFDDDLWLKWDRPYDTGPWVPGPYFPGNLAQGDDGYYVCIKPDDGTGKFPNASWQLLTPEKQLDVPRAIEVWCRMIGTCGLDAS